MAGVLISIKLLTGAYRGEKGHLIYTKMLMTFDVTFYLVLFLPQLWNLQQQAVIVLQ